MQKYGIKYCNAYDDYWARAVEICGGVDKLPSSDQIDKIANYVYNRNDLSSNDNFRSDVVLEPDKAISLGFTLDSSNAFFLWSADEIDVQLINTRAFRMNSTSVQGFKDISTRQAFCVEAQ